ncbi:MAG: helix-turn-helix transcriptional regulator [Rickettsiales bacterium]|nr:helix-turn-helix transcriptional regulator [Rickettsiales bacterium]
MKRKEVEQFINNYAADIKKRRKSLGYSHDKLADRSGVTRQAISKIEAGNSNPTLATMLRLASALDVRISDMLEQIED